MIELGLNGAVEIAAAVRNRQFSAETVVRACLDRIRERDPQIGAFSHVCEESALARARQLDSQVKISGVLAGVPFAIKEIIDYEGSPVSWGSPVYADRRPSSSAQCIKLFLSAGAIPLGMSVSTEFACFTPGKTVNPHNFGHTPGGSSSGSAAAVADGMVQIGFGSQTAASLIRPAAYCGIFAYKSTQGSIDLDGVMGLSDKLDSLGVLARAASDLELARAVLQMRPSSEKLNSSSPPSITLFRGPHWGECSSDGQDAFERTASRLASAGAICKEMECPGEFEGLSDAHKIVMAYDIVRTRRLEVQRNRNALSAKFLELYDSGTLITRREYEEALLLRDTCCSRLTEMFQDADVLITPSTHGEAPEGLDSTGDPLFSRLWTLLQVPATTVPVGFGSRNLPLSIQLIGAMNRDGKLISATNWIADRLSNAC